MSLRSIPEERDQEREGVKESEAIGAASWSISVGRNQEREGESRSEATGVASFLGGLWEWVFI